MILRQMQYFHAIVRTGSFTEAAEECFISQSAISQQIKVLENDLGVKLLVRAKRGFHLTKAGEYFYQKSGQLLEELEQVRKETIQIGCGSQNVLRLGYLKSYSGKELLNAVLEYNDIFPDTQVHIQNGNHEALYQLLNNNQLDLVLNDQRRAACRREQRCTDRGGISGETLQYGLCKKNSINQVWNANDKTVLSVLESGK